MSRAKLEKPFRIGTRGSKLALWQANEVKRRLLLAHPTIFNKRSIEIVKIKTSGDIIQDRSLSEIDGKSLFTKEIEEAMLKGNIEIAVHSMKDVPYKLPEGLIIGAILPREDFRDAFIGKKPFLELPKNACVGTSSLRRKHQILRLRPDISVVPIRGNVDTRLAKLETGAIDATILAVAGLKRLGIAHVISSKFSTRQMVPAVAQGAIGIECRNLDHHTKTLLEAINHPPTSLCVNTERQVMKYVEASCHTPLGVVAKIQGKLISLRAFLYNEVTQELRTSYRSGNMLDFYEVGRQVGKDLLL